LTELLCIGNPIVDIFIEIDKRLAVKYGILEPAVHIEYEKAQVILSESSIDFKNAIRSSGGGAANVAKNASMLGMKTAF